MMNLSGLAVVQGPAYFSSAVYQPFREDGGRSRGLEQAAQLSACYEGIEGTYWPDEAEGLDIDAGVLLPFDQAELAIRYFLASETRKSARLIAIGGPDDPRPTLPFGFAPCGFEVGRLDSPFDKFSCVFNEVLFGSLEPLVEFRTKLNSSCLFERKEQADAFLLARSRQRSVEVFRDKAVPVVMQVWRYRTPLESLPPSGNH